MSVFFRIAGGFEDVCRDRSRNLRRGEFAAGKPSGCGAVCVEDL